ncbi:hypothetical protein PUN28_008672 [Cardiocondyla obscurior]|uniref:Uncharacterized protein n=1 Tax=Cardiocondyla obscurior TaxID=286306 RepID=A0AAW2G0R4_9HYME
MEFEKIKERKRDGKPQLETHDRAESTRLHDSIHHRGKEGSSHKPERRQRGRTREKRIREDAKKRTNKGTPRVVESIGSISQIVYRSNYPESLKNLLSIPPPCILLHNYASRKEREKVACLKAHGKDPVSGLVRLHNSRFTLNYLRALVNRDPNSFRR